MVNLLISNDRNLLHVTCHLKDILYNVSHYMLAHKDVYGRRNKRNIFNLFVKCLQKAQFFFPVLLEPFK